MDNLLDDLGAGDYRDSFTDWLIRDKARRAVREHYAKGLRGEELLDHVTKDVFFWSTGNVIIDWEEVDRIVEEFENE
jgi:hypothetical protein